MAPLDGIFDGMTDLQIQGAVGLLILAGLFVGFVWVVIRKGKGK